MNQEKLNTYFKQTFIDLAQARLGGETLSCSDDFFAEMENLLKPGRGIFIEDKFTDRGKWMDGWESRRSYGRDNGRDFDWCIIRLGIPGIISGFDIDTHFFRGNAPQSISVEACHCKGDIKDAVWITVLEQKSTQAHSQNLFLIDELDNKKQVWTHVRLNIFPDGGVARFRVFGEAKFEPNNFISGELIDLASIKNGAKAMLCSDMFFSDKNNLIMPERGINMGDGWETKRRRDPGPDWLIVKLALEGDFQKLIIDTVHFKGNFPDTFSLEASNGTDDDVLAGNVKWQSVVNKTKLFADREHLFISDIISEKQTFSHIRLNIFPDGGISRLRLFGLPKESL
ncbi:allantoicase [Pseudoalteromonas denitrificans]|uniref:Probable allantoicase n=1 Tax=Pseudoalteromonas denitrificans DSM 6059 TaxID=1123010 RepID=A0A1I1LC36_9GAMM|nr:allantoicase [Pseudoalteromonas denitrificans]SFC68568.1 allantoicase [Pseudoalteromonas denitrificans DSM 6059]